MLGFASLVLMLSNVDVVVWIIVVGCSDAAIDLAISIPDGRGER